MTDDEAHAALLSGKTIIVRHPYDEKSGDKITKRVRLRAMSREEFQKLVADD